MKTTVEIADALFEEAKRVSAARRTTLRALIEEGLRRVLEEQESSRGVFRLRRVAVGGRGLHPEVEEGSWERIRERIYKGRGA